MVLHKVDWLNAATVVGDVTTPETVFATRFLVQARATGGASWSVALEVSADGVTWDRLPNGSSDASNGAVTQEYVSECPVPYIRLRLSSLSGGSSPTVTASLVAAD